MCYAQLSPLYLLSTLHITHVDKLLQALYHFFVLQPMESGAGGRNEAIISISVVSSIV